MSRKISASGSSEYIPAASCLANPARNSKRWLLISTSPETCLSVGEKNWEVRTIRSCQKLFHNLVSRL